MWTVTQMSCHIEAPPNKALQLTANPLWTCPDKVDTFLRVEEVSNETKTSCPIRS